MTLPTDRRLPLLALFAVLAGLAGCSASHTTCTRGDCPDGGPPIDTARSDAPRGDTGSSCIAHPPATHRPSGSACDMVRPPGSSPDPGMGIPSECTTDAECVTGTNGRCNGNSHDGWRCTYDSCFTDDGCSDSSVCQCEGSFRSDANACLPGDCRTDDDCSTGYCSPTLGSCGDYTGPVGWFCHTCEDECVDDLDCEGRDAGPFGRSYCAFDPMRGRWACQNSHCAG